MFRGTEAAGEIAGRIASECEIRGEGDRKVTWALRIFVRDIVEKEDSMTMDSVTIAFKVSASVVGRGSSELEELRCNCSVPAASLILSIVGS